jgi:nucleoside-diphosphate-sugar epimerase
VRRRRYVLIGDGGGITWFIHPDAAAAAVIVLALEHDGSAVYNITDDESGRCVSGCRRWRPRSAPARRYPPWAGGCSRAQPATSRQPITRRSV